MRSVLDTREATALFALPSPFRAFRTVESRPRVLLLLLLAACRADRVAEEPSSSACPDCSLDCTSDTLPMAAEHMRAPLSMRQVQTSLQ